MATGALISPIRGHPGQLALGPSVLEEEAYGICCSTRQIKTVGWVEVGTGGALGRFVLGGAVNTCLTDVLFLVLSSILPYPVAYTIVYACGIAIAYALATSFVFRTNFALRTALRFPIVSVARYFYGLVARAREFGLDLFWFDSTGRSRMHFCRIWRTAPSS